MDDEAMGVEARMNILKIVELYTLTLHVVDADVFLRQTDKKVWDHLRAELKGTSKADRVKMWDERLDELVGERYQTEANAFLVPEYRGKSTYAPNWRRRKIAAKWRFVNIFRHERKAEGRVKVKERDHADGDGDVEIRGMITRDGVWDFEGIAKILMCMLSRVPEELFDRALEQAQARVRKTRAA